MAETRPSESDRMLARHLVESGMVRREQVDECLEELARLASENADPPPSLDDLLRSKGYLSGQAVVETVRLPGGGTPAPEGMPAAAARAAVDTANKFGKYVRESRLGAGGVGEVWRAWDRELGRWVALKFLKGEDPEEFARFQREAQTAAKLAHPNICAVYDVGRLEHRPYIAMQYVRGRTLAAFPKARRRLLVELVRDAAQAIHYAHGQGVVHRDLKPHNIMAEGSGEEAGAHRVYVMDFGMSKQTSVASSISISGMILGTPSYMSPEQAQGRAPEVGPRSDIYGLGATLFDLLAGRPPFLDSEVYSLLRRIIDEEPPSLRTLDASIDSDLETIVAKCLEKDPSRRYGTAQELADDLNRYLTSEPIVARPTTIVYRAQKWVRKRRALTAALAAVILLAVGGGAYFVNEGIRRAAEQRAAELLQRAVGHANEAKVIWRVKSARPAQWETLFDRAVSEANQAIAEFPEMARAHHTRGQILLARRQWRPAIQAYDRALELDPTLADAWYGRGLCYLELYIIGLIQTAAMREGSTGIPEFFDTDRSRVAPLRENTLHNLKRYAELRGEAAAGTLEVRTANAAFALADGKYVEAERICNSILNEDRTDERVWLFKMFAQVGLKQLLPAVASLQNQIDAAPNHGRAYVGRGFIRGRLGNRTAGRADLDRAVELEPDNPEVRLLVGVARATLGDAKPALADLDRAVELQPDVAAIWVSRAWVKALLRDWEGCRADATRGIELDPEAAKGFWFRGWAKRHSRDFQGALEDLTRSGELDPKNVGVMADRADVRLSLGDRDGALEDCRNALENAPDDPRAYVVLVRLGAENGNWQTVLDEAVRILERKGERAEALFLRGRCLLELEQPGPALQDFQKAAGRSALLKRRAAPFIARCRKEIRNPR